jgi:dTDP-4-dehydrorhamnose reductase
MLRLADAGQREVAVVTDQVACPTFTGHLAVRVVELAEQGRGGIFHVAAAGHCSWNAFARAIFEAAGLEVAVTETNSREFVRPAARPAWSVLGTERDGGDGLPAWTEGVVAYLELVRGEVVR